MYHCWNMFLMFILTILVINSTIAGKAPKLGEVKSKVSINLGNKFKFTCYLEDGNKVPVKFEWYRNGQLLSIGINTRYKIDNSPDESVLIINKLETNDSANYSCTARSTFGTDTQSTTLTVKGWI